MKKSVELKQERANKEAEMSALIELRKKENRSFSEEEVTSFDTLESEIRSLDGQIEREEKIEAHEARQVQNKPAATSNKKETPQERFSLIKALGALARGEALTGAEKEVHEEAAAEMRSNGLEVGEGLRIALPLGEERAQSVSDDAGAKGGALVPSTPQLVQPLQPILPIEALGVNVMSGLVGDVPLPSSGSFSFSYVGETEDVTPTDVDFSGPTLKPKRCSGVVEISRKLLLQTSFNVESYLIGLINVAYGNAITVNGINGAGGDAPTGLYSLITTNINTTAGVPTHATIVDLEALVDAANGTNFSRGYFSDTKLRALMKTTKIDAGSGIFLSDGKELNGYNYQASTLAPTLDAGASHPLIFGDWKQMHVGYWGNLSIMVDPYTKASAGKVRLIIDGYSDVAVTNEKAFAINKVMTLS